MKKDKWTQRGAAFHRAVTGGAISSDEQEVFAHAAGLANLHMNDAQARKIARFIFNQDLRRAHKIHAVSELFSALTGLDPADLYLNWPASGEKHPLWDAAMQWDGGVPEEPVNEQHEKYVPYSIARRGVPQEVEHPPWRPKQGDRVLLSTPQGDKEGFVVNPGEGRLIRGIALIAENELIEDIPLDMVRPA